MNELKFYRKNTSTILLDICDYEFNDGDVIYFTVKPKPDNDTQDEKAVIKAEFIYGESATINSDGHLELILTADQTDIDFGDYFYDIKVVSSEQSPSAENTLVTGKFTIMEVSTLRV